MKTLNIPLEDKEHEELNDARGEMSWKEFLFSKLKRRVGNTTSDLKKKEVKGK